jgi:hypothetical protein
MKSGVDPVKGCEVSCEINDNYSSFIEFPVRFLEVTGGDASLAIIDPNNPDGDKNCFVTPEEGWYILGVTWPAVHVSAAINYNFEWTCKDKFGNSKKIQTRETLSDVLLGMPGIQNVSTATRPVWLEKDIECSLFIWLSDDPATEQENIPQTTMRSVARASIVQLSQSVPYVVADSRYVKTSNVLGNVKINQGGTMSLNRPAVIKTTDYSYVNGIKLTVAGHSFADLCVMRAVLKLSFYGNYDYVSYSGSTMYPQLFCETSIYHSERQGNVRSLFQTGDSDYSFNFNDDERGRNYYLFFDNMKCYWWYSRALLTAAGNGMTVSAECTGTDANGNIVSFPVEIETLTSSQVNVVLPTTEPVPVQRPANLNRWYHCVDTEQSNQNANWYVYNILKLKKTGQIGQTSLSYGFTMSSCNGDSRSASGILTVKNQGDDIMPKIFCSYFETEDQMSTGVKSHQRPIYVQVYYNSSLEPDYYYIKVFIEANQTFIFRPLSSLNPTISNDSYKRESNFVLPPHRVIDYHFRLSKGGDPPDTPGFDNTGADEQKMFAFYPVNRLVSVSETGVYQGRREVPLPQTTNWPEDWTRFYDAGLVSGQNNVTVIKVSLFGPVGNQYSEYLLTLTSVSGAWKSLGVNRVTALQPDTNVGDTITGIEFRAKVDDSQKVLLYMKRPTGKTIVGKAEIIIANNVSETDSLLTGVFLNESDMDSTGYDMTMTTH